MKNFNLFIFSLLLWQGSVFCNEGARSASSNERLFSITPDEMVFASKLNEENRKLFCYKFSINERQQALQKWQEQQEDSEESASLTPDDAVQDVFQSFSSEESVVTSP